MYINSGDLRRVLALYSPHLGECGKTVVGGTAQKGGAARAAFPGDE